MTRKTTPIAAAFLLATALPVTAGEIDLAAAGCPEPPEADRFMSVHMILDGQGGARDCVISANPRDHCEQYHSFEEGFLCLGLTHNPRPDITAAETTGSTRVDRLVIDGEETEDDWGKTIARKDLATGLSGDTYDILVEHNIDGVPHVMTVNVTATPDGPVKINSVAVTYAD